jgi:hypothetical protein
MRDEFDALELESGGDTMYRDTWKEGKTVEAGEIDDVARVVVDGGGSFQEVVEYPLRKVPCCHCSDRLFAYDLLYHLFVPPLVLTSL